MNLIEKTDSPDTGRVQIDTGSGNFLIEGRPGYRGKTVRVFYHKPENFNVQSRILMVIPGSGRDGDEYRDAWVKAAEKHGVLILAPTYSEDDYGFKDYHMGGVIDQSNILDNVTFMDNSNVVELDEKDLILQVNANRNEWIFNDFNRIFELAAEAAGSTREHYDLFGHSAGGQILHRTVLFTPDIKADRILASNSGFYTLPDFEIRLPFGLKNTPIDEESLKNSFERHLILFIGELDNEHETGGLLLRSPTVDEQGTHRLERGRYFYRTAKSKAEEMGSEFNWKLEIVPEVGHEFEKMSRAAAEYLYGE